MHDHDDQCSGKIKDNHKRNKSFRECRYSFQTADNDSTDRDEQEDAGDELGNTEGGVDIGYHRVDLAHIADAEGGDDTEDGEQQSKRCADCLHARLCAKTVLEIIHGAAAPLTIGVLSAVKDTEDVFRVVCHHSEECDQDHPEYRAGSADGDRACHADDIAGADCCGKGSA